MRETRRKELEWLQEELGIKFNDLALLHQALIHKSFLHESEDPAVGDNERLEFLGDAVLELIVTTFIYREFEDYPEGALAQLRAGVVSEPVLGKQAGEISLGRYLLLGRGEEGTGGRQRLSILADSFEALIGAIYLDSGFEKAGEFVLDYLEDEIYRLSERKYLRDFKTLLQEYAQDKYQIQPTYRVISEEGPDHRKEFLVEVVLRGERLGTGKGRSKKDAQQRAAEEALTRLGEL